jgi:hypothetical protein
MNFRRRLVLCLLMSGGANACRNSDPATDTCTSWSHPFYGSQSQTALAVTSAERCDLVVAGILAGQSELESKPVAPAAGSISTSYRMYLARLSGVGRIVWKKILAPAGGYFVASELFLARLPAGDVVLAGTLFQPLDLEGNLLTPASRDWFVARLTDRGKVVFAKLIGGPDPDRLEGLAAGPDGSILLAGLLGASADLDGRPLPFGGTVVRLDAAGTLLGTAGFGARAVRAIDVDEQGAAAVLVESRGPCPPCPMPVGGGSLCGHLCPPATATTIAMRLDPALAVTWESPPVTTEELRFEPRLRRAAIRWSGQGGLMVLVADGAAASIREYGPGGQILRELALGDGRAAYLPRIAGGPSGNPVLVQTRPVPRVIELDGALTVVRSRDMAAAGLNVEDFTVDGSGGVLVGGSVFGALDLAGSRWDTEGSRGSISARLDPGFKGAMVDGGACGGTGVPCTDHTGCCAGLFCGPYAPDAERPICGPISQ